MAGRNVVFVGDDLRIGPRGAPAGLPHSKGSRMVKRDGASGVARRLLFVDLYAVTFAVGLLVASVTANSTVDSVAMSHDQARGIVDAVNLNPDLIRIGFLAVVLALACIGPVVAPLRELAPDRGRGLVVWGHRLMWTGAIAGAIGNAFAPLVLGSVAGLDRDVMATFIQNNETSWVSYALLALYALLAVGTVLVAVGLVRAGTAPIWQILLFAVVFVAFLLLSLGIESIVLTILFAIDYLVLIRPAAQRARQPAAGS
jgi:hypothetical protein